MLKNVLTRVKFIWNYGILSRIMFFTLPILVIAIITIHVLLNREQDVNLRARDPLGFLLFLTYVAACALLVNLSLFHWWLADWQKCGFNLTLYPRDKVERQALKDWAQQELEKNALELLRACNFREMKEAEKEAAIKSLDDYCEIARIRELSEVVDFRKEREHRKELIRTAKKEARAAIRAENRSRAQYERVWLLFRTLDIYRVRRNEDDKSPLPFHSSEYLTDLAKKVEI